MSHAEIHGKGHATPGQTMQKTPLRLVPNSKLHVAILLDGNGRWAASRGLPRSEGHRAGVEAVRRVVRAAPGAGIGTLTLYAFSSNNWERPSGEVGSLLAILEDFLRKEAATCAADGVRVRVIGRRDRIPRSLVEAIDLVECHTDGGHQLNLRIAIDYSSRDAMLRAACWMLSSLEVSEREFARRLGRVAHADTPAPDVDLLIRTGGDQLVERFHALGIGLCRIAVCSQDVARIRSRRSGCRGRRVPRT